MYFIEMKRDIIRIGDTVKIINPRYIIRVGYPKILTDYIPEVEDKYQDILKNIPREAYNKVKMALAYAIAVKDKFGGSERSVHFDNALELANKEFQVIDIRYVKTGKYCSGGYNSGGWDGEGDYDPPYLCDIKCHKILCINAPYVLEVLATDVEKIKCEVKQLCHQS